MKTKLSAVRPLKRTRGWIFINSRQCIALLFVTDFQTADEQERQARLCQSSRARRRHQLVFVFCCAAVVIRSVNLTAL